MSKAKPKTKTDSTTRVRLDVSPAEHRHLRVAAAEANVPMAQYARGLVQADMERVRKISKNSEKTH